MQWDAEASLHIGLGIGKTASAIANHFDAEFRARANHESFSSFPAG